MRLLVLLLSVLIATPFPARPTAQSTPPTQPAPSPSSDCFELRLTEIEGVNHHWARIRAGDEWISGCLGSAGKCVTAIWVPC